MKKILALLLLVILVGCSSNKAKLDDFGYETLTNKNHIIKEVTYNDIKKMNEAKESYYLMIGRPSCSHCVDSIYDFSTNAKNAGQDVVYYLSVEKIVQEMQENGVNAEAKLSKESQETMDGLSNDFNFDGATPIFYHVIDGKKSSSSDDVDARNLANWDSILKRFFEMTKSNK